MAKQKLKPGDMYWTAIYYNSNAQEFQPYNVLKYKEDFVKQLKKKVESKEEFSQRMKSEMMYYFWSKCEIEVILTNQGDRIIMSPWIGPEDLILDVTDREDFNWVDFFNKKVECYTNKTKIKIDIWDQIFYQWDDFINYCWNFRHKWQRKNLGRRDEH